MSLESKVREPEGHAEKQKSGMQKAEMGPQDCETTAPLTTDSGTALEKQKAER